MKILCVVDHFGSGGAQRQIVNLAIGLAARGHNVDFFVYHKEHNFFEHLLEEKNIRIYKIDIHKTSIPSFLKALIQIITKNEYKAVISYLAIPSALCEIIKPFNGKHKLLVSERSNFLDEKSMLKSIMLRLLHTFSDHVICNSYTQASWIRKKFPWLKRKTVSIHNGYDIALYQQRTISKTTHSGLSLIGIGRLSPEKNIECLIHALVLFHQRNGWCPNVKWVGSLTHSADQAYVNRLKVLLLQYSAVNEQWLFAGELSSVNDLISGSHALVLPSLYEGLPNVLCEALLLGRPVIASDVCDMPQLITNHYNGFLFNPHSSAALMSCIETLVRMPEDEYRLMCSNARTFACDHLSIDRLVSEYEFFLK